MLEEVISKANAHGMKIDHFLIDGKWHGFTWGGGETHNGAYKAHRTAYGTEFFFKDWKDKSKKISWTYCGEELSPEEFKKHKEVMSERLKDEEIKVNARRALAKIRAKGMWDISLEDPSHTYLKKKRLTSPYGSRISPSGVLYIPVRDASGELWGLQTINAHGVKMNLRDSKMKGGFHLIRGAADGPIFIAEGFATCATLHKLTGYTTACTFSSSNFISVGEALKAKYPDTQLIFSGDADEAGRTASKIASSYLKTRFIVPKFKTPHPEYTDWNDLEDLEGGQEVLHQISEFRPKKQFESKQKWITETLDENGFKFFYDGTCEWNGSSTHGPDFIQNELFLLSEKEGAGCSMALISTYMSNRIELDKEKIYQEIVSSVFQTAGTDHGEVEKFLIALIGSAQEEQVSVFKHFLWQVKRKALELPVEHHIMPVIIGLPGAGKSMAMEKLVNPLRDLVHYSDLKACEDDRKGALFHDSLVIVMDEMSKCAQTDISALKRMVTSHKVTYRILGTNKFKTGTNKATLIGTSNSPIKALIKDITGNRRFYPLNALPKGEVDWATINSIDYLNMWRAVDANNPCPILPHLAAIHETQEKGRHRHDIERWLNEMGAYPCKESLIKSSDLFREWGSWKDLNKTYEISKSFLTDMLESLGYESKEINRYVYFYMYFPGLGDRNI